MEDSERMRMAICTGTSDASTDSAMNCTIFLKKDIFINAKKLEKSFFFELNDRLN